MENNIDRALSCENLLRTYPFNLIGHVINSESRAKIMSVDIYQFLKEVDQLNETEKKLIAQRYIYCESVESSLNLVDGSVRKFDNLVRSVFTKLQRNKSLYMSVYNEEDYREFKDKYRRTVHELEIIKHKYDELKITNRVLRERYDNLERPEQQCKGTLDMVSEEVLNITLRDLDLSGRLFNTLNRVRIKTIRDLANLTYVELREVKGLGIKSLREAVWVLDKFGITLIGTP